MSGDGHDRGNRARLIEAERVRELVRERLDCGVGSEMNVRRPCPRVKGLVERRRNRVGGRQRSR